MFEYVKGELVHILPTYIVIEVQGVGYRLFSANPFRFQTHLKKHVTVYVYQAVREDAITLYGFETLEEKQLFMKLISVSGIGPKSALSILASGDSQGLVKAIEENNSAYLTKFPGVGKKTAAQIVLDLKGQLSDMSTTIVMAEQIVPSGILSEVKDALSGLGYSEREIKKVLPRLEKESFTDTSSALSSAFKWLLGK